MIPDKPLRGLSFNIAELAKYLEITQPFLMIDYVDSLIPGKSAHGVKKLSQDDWYFNCHLKREMAMPGTLQIEAMLQTLVMTIYTIDGHKGKLSFITQINTKLISKISPGPNLEIFADLLSFNRGISKGVAVGKINNVTVCQGKFTFVSPHELPRLTI